MAVLVTGAAGFIGSQVAQALLDRGQAVIGIDNINAYYDTGLKRARLERLEGNKLNGTAGFRFFPVDISDRAAMEDLAAREGAGIEGIVHLAAQAGVRYSLTNPFAYVASNLVGHMTVLELARHLPKLQQLVYASSSSVYGGNSKVPFSIEDRVDDPLSLYAATKRADEALSISYAHSHGLAQTGLRFFTVYGPWGRPDMAYFKFTKAILEGRPIDVYAEAEMSRDFTYVDDIREAIVRLAGKPAQADPDFDLARPDPATGAAPYRIYNIGNHTPVRLDRFIAVVEEACGRKAIKRHLPAQPGDVPATYADVSDLAARVGFSPDTPIEHGIARFVDWYRSFYKV